MFVILLKLLVARDFGVLILLIVDCLLFTLENVVLS